MQLESATVVGEDADTDYFWMSATEVLWLRHATCHDKPRVTVNNRAGAIFRSLQPGHFEALSIDTLTGEAHPLDAFNATSGKLMTASTMVVETAGERTRDIHHIPPECALSPDGTWLLWRCVRHGHRSEWIAATLDGARQVRWEQTHSKNDCGAAQVVWKNDLEWIAISGAYFKGSHSLDVARTYRIDSRECLHEVLLASVADGLMLGLTSDANLLLYDAALQRRPGEKPQFREIRVDLEGGATESYSVDVPGNEDVSCVALSPQGNQLAWILGSMDSAHYGLWVSDRRGSGFRELGRLDARSYEDPDRKGGRRYDWPRSLKWIPAGDRVSLIHGTTLYTVSIG